MKKDKGESFFESHTLSIILIVLYYAMTIPVIKNLFSRSCGPVISTGVLVSGLIAVTISVVLLVKMKKAKTYSISEYIGILLLIYVPLIIALLLYYRNFC